MAKWDFLRAEEFKELHLDTNSLSTDQADMLRKHNEVVEFAFLIRKWVENTPTTNSSEYRGFKNHFIGKTSCQWTNVRQLGLDLKELENPNVLLEVQSKYEIGLNSLHLIKQTMEEINQMSMFFCNKKKMRKKIIKAHRGLTILKSTISRLLEETPSRSSGDLEFFGKTEILIGSIDWNYLKVITEVGEHNQRRIIDAFF